MIYKDYRAREITQWARALRKFYIRFLESSMIFENFQAKFLIITPRVLALKHYQVAPTQTKKTTKAGKSTTYFHVNIEKC